MEKRLLRLMAAYHAVVVAWEKKIQTLRDKLITSGICQHTSTVDFQWEHDNGYGHQSMHNGKRCTACGKRKHYQSSSYWSGE